MAWQTPKTNWTPSDPIGTADLNRIEGNEAQLRTDLDAHTAATTSVHGATSAAMANRLVIRDANGRAKFAAPSASDDAARKAEVDAVQSNLTNHIADYVRHPGYAVTGGSGNAYTVTLSPAPSGYVDGMGVVIRANRDNTGPSTLNVNGLGAKTIKRANGLDIAPGMIKNGGIYTLRYNNASGNFILQGEGSDLQALYMPGVEYVPWVQGIANNGSVSKESDHIKISLPEGSAEAAAVTDITIDLTNIRGILVEAQEISNDGGSAYLIASTQKNGGYNTFDARAGIPNVIGVPQRSVMDVTTLTGSYYIRIHRQATASSGTKEFRIYRVIAFP